MPEDPAAVPATDLLQQAVEARDGSLFLKIAEDLHYADLADVYEHLGDDEEREFFVHTLSPERFSDVLAELPYSMVPAALEGLRPSQQRKILQAADDDDRVDILQELSEGKQEELLALLPKSEELRTRTLLEYDEDTAGGRMTTRVARVTEGMSVRQALDSLRHQQDDAETLSRIFVVDGAGHLVGKLRLRDLAFSTWDTPLHDIMEPVEHSILASADQEEAATLFARYDLLALPVVDEESRLLGLITHDDAMEILETESTEDLEKMSGIAGEQREETYLNTTVMTHFSRRFGWILTLAFFAIASGYVVLHFQNVLNQAFLLALFMPMVISAGGNTGGQAATLVIRSMALGELGIDDLARVAWKELRLGLLLGGLLGVCMAATAMLVVPRFHPAVPAGFSYHRFGLAVAVALATQIVTSALIGSLLPLAAKAARLDPAVIAHPAITTTVDISGMLIYFSVAKALLGI